MKNTTPDNYRNERLARESVGRELARFISNETFERVMEARRKLDEAQDEYREAARTAAEGSR